MLMDKEEKIVFNENTVTEFKKLLKQGYKIKDYNGRKSFIESHRVNRYIEQYGEYINQRLRDAGSRDKQNINTTNTYYELAFTYLVRATDIESPRSGEYSFYRDENRFSISERHTFIPDGDSVKPEDGKAKNPNHTLDVYNIEHNSVSYYLRDYESLSPNDKIEILRDYSTAFSNVLEFGSDEDYMVGRQLAEMVRDEFIAKCSDELDFDIVNMTSEGYTYREIAEKTNVSKSNVHKRLKKIAK